VAIDITTARLWDGRVISDELQMHIFKIWWFWQMEEFGRGKMILETLLEECRSRKITWIGLMQSRE